MGVKYFHEILTIEFHNPFGRTIISAEFLCATSANTSACGMATLVNEACDRGEEECELYYKCRADDTASFRTLLRLAVRGNEVAKGKRQLHTGVSNHFLCICAIFYKLHFITSI